MKSFTIFGIIVVINIIRFSTVESQNINNATNSCPSAQQSRCIETGECIETIKFCNGEFDCTDKSDETESMCSKHRCPRSRFQCQYGGCIPKIKKCDNITDCFDGSDEDNNICLFNGPIKLNQAPGINFGISECELQNQFECLSGQCINRTSICDNIYDCSDRSDESFNKCRNYRCGRNFFKCNSGGCIHRSKRCNEQIDCLDGSDENEFAGCSKIIKFDGGSSDANKAEQEPSECIVPSIEHLVMYQGPKIRNIIVKPGQIVSPSMEEFSYGCEDDSYKIISTSSSNRNYCFGNSSYSHWVRDHVVCKKFCSSAELKGISFKATCNNIFSDCQEKPEWPPGTTAFLTCAFGYEKPDIFFEVLSCKENGNWSRTPRRCDASCGVISSILDPYVYKGNDTEIINVPWQVAIFLRRSLQPFDYKNVCGGTIINSKLILSAAHCFWDNNVKFSRRIDPSNFMIVVGTSYRNFNSRETGSQAFSVQQIIEHRNFEGSEHIYSYDIAVAVLNSSIIYSAYAIPICIESNIEYADKNMATGVLGMIAGWGKMGDNKYPEILQSNEITTLSHDDCKKKANQFLAPDKFCLDYSLSNSTSQVCHGDSGGGFVVPKASKDGDRYYLRGVLSTGYYTLGCGEKSVAGFTNIYEHDYIGMIDYYKHYPLYDPK